MHRIGIKDPEDAYALVQKIDSNFVHIEGIYTHFADADNQDGTYTNYQFNKFLEVVTYLENNGVYIPLKHCCNSAATIQFPEMHLDMVRVGVSLYGLYPEEHLESFISLRPAMSLKTKPVYFKTVKEKEPISYGCTFVPQEDALIATMPIGYADGLSRLLSNKGYVTLKNKKAPIVGRICMDQSMIDVSHIPNVTTDDVITIFGDPKEGHIPIGEVAKIMSTIHYETACLIGHRVPRVYLENGNIISQKSMLISVRNN